MAVLLIPALFLGAIAIALLCLAIAGALLTLAVHVLTGILWATVRLLERRSATVPMIEITIEDDERPMRDVTTRNSTRQLMATAQR